MEHFRAGRTYAQRFYTVRTEKAKKRPGLIYGWPFSVTGAWCNSDLKMAAIRKALKSTKNVIQYVGIAADESNRFHNLTSIKKSPLVEAGWDEKYCRDWCERNGLLSPIYTDSARGAAGSAIIRV